MKTQALKGMRDLLPAEQTLRDYIQGKILETYRSAGFERISTPMLEDMENLDKSEGGDNLNLIFKVLKRGDKLTAALNTGDPKQLSDMGLRYDLTLPLSRYYAANKDKLPNPFKVIQTDRVFRAERPQKGRLREFVQCDIDILGDASPNAEVELIDVTTRALLNIGFTGFTVNINDRRILRGMLESMGFAADTLDSVCITFDKMDKIGAEGVKAELTEKQLPESAIQALADFIAAGDVTLDAVAARCADPAIADDLKYVLATANTLAAGRYQVAYCPSLVRGQGYYTGMVFEVTCPQFSGAVAGGGRYDNMVGKFLGVQVPAVGFSIGFERVCGILLEQGYQIPGAKQKIALLYGKDADVVNAYQYSNVDAIFSRSLSIAQYKSSTNTLAITYRTNQLECLLLNNYLGSMTNNMRTAIRSCINIDSIVQSVYMSMVDRTNTPMIQGTWMYNSNLSSYFQVDLNKARQLLEEDGWYDTDGSGYVDKPNKNNEAADLTYNIITYEEPDNSVRVQAANMIADMLGQIGIKATVETVSYSTMQERLKAGNFHIALVSFAMDVCPDPGFLLMSGNTCNYVAYRSTTMDALFKKLRTQVTQADYQAVLYDIQEQFAKDCPFICLYYRGGTVLTRRMYTTTRDVREGHLLDGIESFYD